MRDATKAGAVGGLAAGLLLSGVTRFGRDAGILQRPLGENVEGWINRLFKPRRGVGGNGTDLVEQVVHLNTAIAFGGLYGRLRGFMKGAPPLVLGALYGAGLYAVAIGTVAPRLGLARDVDETPPGVSLQRFGLHILFGVATALATEALLDKPRRKG